jgi:pilus assembly protein Flp/PilA
MLNRIRTTLRRDEGASAVEYGLLIAAVAAVIAGVVFVLGGRLKTAFTQVCTSVSSTSATC